jgi:hypothetical protein
VTFTFKKPTPVSHVVMQSRKSHGSYFPQRFGLVFETLPGGVTPARPAEKPQYSHTIPWAGAEDMRTVELKPTAINGRVLTLAESAARRGGSTVLCNAGTYPRWRQR